MSDVWQRLRAFTQARIGLGRSGAAIPTARLLEFQLAHAQARDAVLQEWNVAAFADRLGESVIKVESGVTNRTDFLKRPDLGRKLASAVTGSAEIVFIVSDGLSAKAIDAHFIPFWQKFKPSLTDFEVAPIVLAPFSRVAVSDEIGAAFSAKLAVIFIGERPGLSSSDSMGIYLTYNPKLGNHDANRNCISNVRPPEGLSYEHAAAKLSYLIRESLRLKLSGVALKEDAGTLTGISTKLI